MGMILKHGELAEALGMNPGQLTEWRKSGMPCVSDGVGRGAAVTYDLAAVFRWVRDTGRHQEAEAEGQLVPTMEQAKLNRSRRLKVDIERRLKAGELVTARKVQAAIFPPVRSLRDGLLSLPDRLAPELAAETDETVCHARLAEEIRAIVDSTEDELRAVAASMTDGEDTAGGGDDE